ncbi:MAG: ATP-binding cassette domain-containing protein [Acidimicrobiia bacterium]|nr:ATP-binding cassette domain-containing protein [Acidimicrobiia bacterium]MYG57423.1 ATP-binding cassette domain-containing protein [Acidimicrobiia bacterium]MYJ31818.1 ATP-binding cassette domain-containing protein [Acidimicrobiia bacterium]
MRISRRWSVASSTVPAAIFAQGLRRTYGEVVAVDSLDLEVAAGEIYGFLGPNGAGKSTVVRMLCTLASMTAGEASVASYDVVSQGDQVRLSIGVALQEAALDGKLTGRETLTLQGRYYGLERSAIPIRIEELAPLLEMGAIDRRVSTYSGGMKRRLDLAAALMHNPEVLFLDEPTTGLDPISRAVVWEQIRRLNRDLGMTIFLTTQYLEEADALTHRVGILNEGLLVAEGTPDELKRTVGSDVVVARVAGDPEAAAAAIAQVPGISHIEVYGNEVSAATGDGASVVSPVAVALSAAGVEVSDLSIHPTTLDDVFLELTGARIEVEE